MVVLPQGCFNDRRLREVLVELACRHLVWQNAVVMAGEILVERLALDIADSGLSSQCRRRRCAAAPERAPKQCNQAVELVTRVHVLGEQVSRVVVPLDFAQFKVATSYALLHPQGVAGQVANFANALPATDTYCGGGVRPHPQWYVNPNITKQCALAQAHSRAFDHSIELGLA
jgi:hypothetical protein